MSTVIYRNGEKILVAPEHLDAHLGNGYFLTIEESLDESIDREAIEEAIEDIVEEITEKILDDLSDDEIREAAKNLNISHWHNTSIDKLKAKIETAQNGDSE